MYAINTVMIVRLGYYTNRKTIQVHNALLVAHKHEEMRKTHNSVKRDVPSSEWDDTCCVTYARNTLDQVF